MERQLREQQSPVTHVRDDAEQRDAEDDPVERARLDMLRRNANAYARAIEGGSARRDLHDEPQNEELMALRELAAADQALADFPAYARYDPNFAEEVRRLEAAIETARRKLAKVRESGSTGEMADRDEHSDRVARARDAMGDEYAEAVARAGRG